MEDTNEVLSFALDIGKNMVKCGAEINRVEETIIRICDAHGIARTEVFSMVSLLTATVRDSEGKTISQNRRVYSYAANFARLDKFNSISRRLCNHQIDLAQAKEEYEKVFENKRLFHPTVLIGSIVAASAFAIFFGGNGWDALFAGIIAVPVYFINTFIHHRRINRLVYTALNSCIAGTLAIVFSHFVPSGNATFVMIGDIMLLIPGLMFTNAFRELFCGDIISGFTRLLDSIMVALSTAVGFAISILGFQAIGW